MKKLLLMSFIFMIFNINNFSFAQEQKQNRFSVSLGISPPIHVSGMGKFYNENWIISDEGIDRKYYRLNYLFSMEYFIKENFFFRLNGGLTTRRIKEHIESDSTFIDYQSGINNEYRLQTHQGIEYKQINWNISAGLGYKLQFKNFSPHFGSEIIFIYYGYGHENGENYLNINNITENQEKIAESSFTMKIDRGYGLGIGIFAGIDYNFSKNIAISFEISNYLLYTNFDGTTSTHLTGNSNINTFPDSQYYDWPGPLLIGLSYRRLNKGT